MAFYTPPMTETQQQPSKGQRFTKAERLLSRSDFDRVFSHKVSAGDTQLTLHISANGTGLARLGLIVSKANGGSPRRNRLKRLLREAFRLNKGAFAGFDLVLLPRGARTPDSFVLLQQSLLSLFEKAHAEWQRRAAGRAS